MFWLIVLFIAPEQTPTGGWALSDTTESSIASSNQTIKLVENIRRQLMQDNYDYQPSEDEDTPTARDDYDRENDTDTTLHDDGRRTTAAASVDSSSYNVSRKDLLYYLDVDKMRRNMDENDLSNAFSDIDNENTLENNLSPEAKYKVIKVKDANPSRRKMSYRRFIKEQSKDGISIIRLDEDAPFPEFQLPRARRQYMSEDSAELGDNGTLSLDTS